MKMIKFRDFERERDCPKELFLGTASEDY